MLIDKLEFKNINSYGNNTQILKFDNNGGLILLCGRNGSGKSTIKQAIELCLFGKVQGKSGKKLALTKLPNRRNNSLYTGIYFKNQVMDDIIIKRYIKPNKFEMFINEESYTNRFKIMSEKEKEKIIGYNFEIFKSFISLNMNDFKNFISLSKEDKENLLNKLFNLNELDILFSIVKDLDNNNQILINNLNDKIYKNEQIILEYKETILKFYQKDKRQKIKEEIISKKPKFEELKKVIKICNFIIEMFNKDISKLNLLKSKKNEEKIRLKIEIENIIKKINLYNNGICPICNTNLTDDKHKNQLKELKSQLKIKNNNINKCDNYLNKCILKNTKINNNINNINNKKIKYQTKFNQLKNKLELLKSEYIELKIKTKNNSTILSIEQEINILEQEIIKNKLIIDKINKKIIIYDELKNLFSINGVRKTMITNALIPINKYLSEFLIKIESEYTAVLNDNFDATIMELNILEIDPETLSKGEDKKINLAIALSYLKLILEMKHSNIIFLDEIFDGVDVENINLTLKVLKEIALEYKINIIIVYHGMEKIVDISIFDKIIKAEKNIFSNIEIKNNKK
jgi:DNA repair exonuclease SbcCD ATPase subunit